METKLLEEIKAALLKFPIYWEGENLLKSKVIEDLREYKVDLIESLLANELIKDFYSIEFKNNTIFKIEEFIGMLRYKNYWNNSYTNFSNDIGLTSDNKYLKYNTDVVLDFPHKDCILEAGMTKEDIGKNEVFYHNVLAKEEIDSLLSPKVLTNVRKYDETGESSITKFTAEDNLVIKGNNLIALHTLKEKYAGQVKLIYIDPPYNTGNDGFRYNDRFNHSTWLTFMRNRLEVARDLLADEGAIYISIDDNEAAYLKVILDELFYRENFLAQIAYERSGVSGLGQGGSFLVNTHESILVYAKNKDKHTIFNDRGLVSLEKKDMTRYNKILNKIGTRVEVDRFVAPSTKEEVIIYKHENYDIGTISLRSFKEREGEIREEYIANFDKVFRNTSVQKENEFQNRILSLCNEGLFSADYKVSRGKNKGEWVTAYYLNQQVFAWLKDSALIEENEIFKTNKLSQFWTHGSIPKADLANEGGVDLRRGKKPENLLKRIIELETEKEDIVLDFFLGSGSTCAVAHKTGRRYIGIEQMDYIEGTTLTRLKNVINGDRSGISKQVDWNGGGSFIYAELCKLNAEYINMINTAKTKENVEEIINVLKENAFLDYRLNIDNLNFYDDRFASLSLEEQQALLIKSLDANQMYLSYSEIDDTQFKITESVREFNNDFYNNQKKGDDES
ncbi:site-specific DNA-methyltransferase [Sporosarcina sp. PTS2304]|uniref:site-specific DNA-methyltransferase n=1 Tax=Sporosarcina sp. PTS2304 TaxID=2283194 RepID=UPI000E0DB59E|nr:site-specific DNA-methyltransferase [Sporosarcina sp. PTS2304]AXI00974.1 site-specific DNA-methyltransferase [Sporosarcina sp. PTS2304]